jgi:UDP-N-acetylenolpyruvoylglucosamine reductase
MLEHSGFKNFHDPETGMAIWDKQPLIFINESAKSTADLIAFRDKIIQKINQDFGITLSQEPELLP